LKLIPRIPWLCIATCLVFSCDDQGSTDSSPDSEADADTDTDTDTDTTPTDLTPENVPLEGACSAETHFGRFTVASDDYGYVTGSVQEYVVPGDVPTALSSSGDCQLLRKENLVCDPPCEALETCDFDGECIPYPSTQDLGTVEVLGLLEEVSMEPVSPGYTYFNTSLPNPPWEEGVLLTLQTSGGSYDPVTLHGVAPISLDQKFTWDLQQGQPLVITWNAPGTEVRSQVRTTLNVDQHGATPATLECWFEDDGEGEVSAEMVDEFLNQGLSGFSSGSIARMTADSGALGSGCMDFWATSSRVPSISVDGYFPCIDDGDCPKGMDCNEKMQFCE